MDRRQFLATAGGAGLLSLAGWRTATSRTTLSNPTVETEDDGETHLHFERDGNRLATLTVQPPHYDADPVPVDVSLWHADGTTITGLEYRLRAIGDGRGVPADVSLTAPQWSPRPTIDLYTADGSAVLAIDDTNGQGDGTLTLQFLVDPMAKSQDRLRVGAAVDLAEPGVFGASYTLEGRATVPLDRHDDAA